MRLAHLADTHLGYRHLHYSDDQGRNVREQDLYAVFNEAIDSAIELGVDAVIHAGDLFDGYHPSTQAIEVALDAFGRLRDAGIPAVIIAGNHSTPRQRSVAHVFGLLERYGSARALWREPEVVRVGELAVTGIPHHPNPELLREWITAAAPVPDAAFNVLVLHVGIEALPRAGSGEVASVELGPEALEQTAGFDYVALGHLHTHYKASLDASYAGSLERLTFHDTAKEKGFALVDLERVGRDGFVRLIPVHARPVHQLPAIVASEHEDLLAPIEAALGKLDLDGAIVRCQVQGVDQHAWRALDRKRLAELTRSCLHLELQPEFRGGEAPPVGASSDLRSFIAERVPKGLDADQVVARAESYLERAEQEMPA